MSVHADLSSPRNLSRIRRFPIIEEDEWSCSVRRDSVTSLSISMSLPSPHPFGKCQPATDDISDFSLSELRGRGSASASETSLSHNRSMSSVNVSSFEQQRNYFKTPTNACSHCGRQAMARRHRDRHKAQLIAERIQRIDGDIGRLMEEKAVLMARLILERAATESSDVPMPIASTLPQEADRRCFNVSGNALTLVICKHFGVCLDSASDV